MIRIGERGRKRGRDLMPGDVVYFATRPLRRVAEVRPGVVASKYPPHREYKVVWVRWEGRSEFEWKAGASSYVTILRSPPERQGYRVGDATAMLPGGLAMTGSAMAVESKIAKLEVRSSGGERQEFDLSYRETARDSDDLVVLLPDLGLDATDFEPYLRSADTHAIAVNLIGFDPSQQPQSTAPISADLHVRLVSAFLAHVRSASAGKRICLVGLSLGADLALRLGEFWRDHPTESTALHRVLLLNPNVNRSTMTIPTIFAEADPNDPVPALRSVLEMPTDQHELVNVCTYIARITRKDFAAISQYAKEFVDNSEPKGYDLIASRLTTVGKFTQHLRVVLSAEYEPHLDELRRATGGDADLFDLTTADHFDLLAAEQLEWLMGFEAHGHHGET